MGRHSTLALASGAVLALGLTTGCGGPAENTRSGSAPHRAEPSASGPAAGGPGAGGPGAGGPVYGGKAVPGLLGQSVWARGTSGDPRAAYCPGSAESTAVSGAEVRCVVGDAVVLTEELPRRGAGDDAGTTRFVTRLLDAATGRQRAEFESVMPSTAPSGNSGSGSGSGLGSGESAGLPSAVGRWRDGSPALLIRSLPTASAGTAGTPGTQEPSTAVYTMYSPTGEKLGSSLVQGEAHLRRPVLDGLVQDPGGGETLTYAPIGGGTGIEVAKADSYEKPVGPGFGYATRVKDDYDGKGGYLVVTDRRTGRTAWSTREMTPPSAVATANRPGTYATAQLRPLTGDRGILLWNPSGSDDAVITVVDLATGRRLAEGPSTPLDITRDEDRTAVSPDGRTAVSQFGTGVVAWDTETGRELWRRKDDTSLRPMAQSPGGVLYAETDGRQALNARTGALLSAYDDIPEFTSNGYGVLRDEKGLFVFRATPAPAEGNP
ncbi:PQQ-binding-like beta-propeller repeat protein [Streptomyces sp. NPDC091371]|uniref:outer membrane protein assembly factor BamB family protein n=1 Tax=Streptomyces sp. NPDC091371 TaxID=3155303 RepID=UPI003412A4EA